MRKLKVSDNRRFLVYDDGTPFFYLGDTAWELFHRLSQEEAEDYLQDRAAKKYTVIQAVALAEHEFDETGPVGFLPLEDNDPTRLNERYFTHVDKIVRRANALGLTIGMLPTWGDKWNASWGAGPEIFTPENAGIYGMILGKRYADADIIWILGGDRPVETETHRAIIREMAAGLAEGDGGAHLRSFHPPGSRSSFEYFPDEPWLDFHMWQSGHSRNRDNYNLVASIYAQSPVKPVIDAEPGYEDHPESFDASNGYLDDYDVRKSAYWAVFAGACGHTYGCHDIWQFFDPARFKPITTPRTPWREAMQLPGAGQMQHLRTLLESRPILARIPDQSLIASDAGDGADHIQATRAGDCSYVFVYSPAGEPFAVRSCWPVNSLARAGWYDPRTGSSQHIGAVEINSSTLFTPPTRGQGQDWVLTLDKVAIER